MEKKKIKLLYLSISIITVIILIISIIVTFTKLYGKSSRHVKVGIEFFEKLQDVEAISDEVSLKYGDFNNVKGTKEMDNIKYTLVNGQYILELNENYKVIGFSNSDKKKKYGENLSEEQCIQYSRKYLEKILKEEFVFNQIKDKNVYDSSYYTISFYKVYKGYTTYSNEILLKIDKYNGELVGYSNKSFDGVKFNSEKNITEEEVKEIYNKYITSLGLSAEILGKPNVGYVNIDGKVNQLCYIITCRITDKDNKVSFDKIIINADSGKIEERSTNIVELIPNK